MSDRLSFVFAKVQLSEKAIPINITNDEEKPKI
jgi:hypothetical protein